MLSDENALKFSELFDLAELQKIQDSFSELTGIASIITLPDGQPVTQPSNFNSLCKIICKSDKRHINCLKSETQLTQMSFNSGYVHIQPCLRTGLWNTGVCIVVGGVHVANWMIGQVKNDELDINEIIEYGETIGISTKEITEAYEQVPFMTGEKLKSISTFLNSIVTELAQKALYKYRHKQITSENNALKKEIKHIKSNYEIRLNHINQGVVAIDPDSRIIYHNSASYSIFNLQPDTYKGFSIYDFAIEIYNIRGEKIDIRDHFANLIADNLNPIENVLLGISVNKGKIIWIKLNSNHIYSAENKLLEVIFSFEDVTIEKNNNDGYIETIQFLRKTQQIASIATYTTRPQEDKWYGSKSLYEILGLNNQRIRSHKEWVDLIHPDFKGEIINCVDDIVSNNKTSYSRSYKIIKQHNNEERWVHDNGVVIRNNEDNTLTVVGTLQDITDLKKEEEQAQLNEEKYKMIFENALDVYYKIDTTDYKVCEISPALKHYTKIKREDIIGQKYNKFCIFEEKWQEFKEKIHAEKRIHDYCTNLYVSGEGLIPVSISANLTYDNYGNPTHIEGFIRDISQRKHMEDMLRLSESRLRSYIEFSPYAVVVWTTSKQLTEVNHAASRITGYNSEELLSMDISLLVADVDRTKFTRHIQKAIDYGLAADELQIQTKSGKIKHVIADTVRMSENEYIGFLSDISYRKRIENSLKQKQYQLEEGEKIAGIGYALINFNKGSWESSSMMDQIIGIDEKYEKKIENWINIIHPDMLEKLKNDFLNEFIPKRLPTMEAEFKIIRQNDHQERWLNVVGKSEFDTNGRIISLGFTLQDITEKKKWVDILYGNEALYRSIINASPDVIVVIGLDGTVKTISPIVKQMYITEDINSIVGHSIFEFIHPDEHERVKNNLKLMFEEYIGSIEYQMIRSNGEVFTSEINGDIIKDNNDNPTGMVFIIRDITQRKQAEDNLSKSKQQLREFAGHLQSIREEEKIALAREIHDDLGQILVAMKIDMGILKKKLTNPLNGLSAESIDKEMTKMLDLTNKTIGIARRIMSDLRSETLNHLGFIEAATIYINNFRERFKINCKFEKNVDKIELSQEQTVALYRILQESLSNIVKHANATNIKVAVCSTNKTLTFQIEDNGCGFDMNSPGKINSYGLIGMKERVTLLDGNINIESHVGAGTSIRIEIPILP
ncbi:PAS/PAC sensor signal transduction histidine kinase [Paludibacter propionicigenes WB4]|uniref:PAS/PAC sensor signal transduction histidine kinase n=2 Tax=Paludibacter TaxID=346096 RepID=E4T1D6_PALPW|nr:PAS/PAC sensor signal transduction histidine kinase [Paludibacter propionicigenes WB4]